jgi:hypothetical protein
MTTKLKQELEKIALLKLKVPTLEKRESECYDLHVCHVQNLKNALEGAYKLGIKENETKYNKLIEAIKDFHKAKNRYHSQIACARLFELAGLPAQYPDNYKKHENSKC